MSSAIERRLRLMRGGGSAFLLRDTFTAADGTNLSGRSVEEGTATPATWTQRIGTHDIQSNRANLSASGSPGTQAVATADAGQADYQITGVVSATAGAGVAFRFNAADNTFYFTQIEPGGDRFKIYEFDGSYIARADIAFTSVEDTFYTIVVTVVGATITATVNGGNEISYGSATRNQTSGHVGIRGDIATARWETFEVISA